MVRLNSLLLHHTKFTKFRFWCVPLESPGYKNETASFRRKCQKLKGRQLVFIDQTNMKEEPQPGKGLAPKGKSAKSASSKRESYKARVDFCCAISPKGPLACHVLSPALRKSEEVRGYTKDLVLEWVNDELSQSIENHDLEHVVIITDKGLRISREELKEEFEDAETPSIDDVLIMPTNAGKLASPLDNAMWADVKRRVRNRRPKSVDEVATFFKQEFFATPAEKIQGWYRKSGVVPGSDVFRDLQ